MSLKNNEAFWLALLLFVGLFTRTSLPNVNGDSDIFRKATWARIHPLIDGIISYAEEWQQTPFYEVILNSHPYNEKWNPIKVKLNIFVTNDDCCLYIAMIVDFLEKVDKICHGEYYPIPGEWHVGTFLDLDRDGNMTTNDAKCLSGTWEHLISAWDSVAWWGETEVASRWTGNGWMIEERVPLNVSGHYIVKPGDTIGFGRYFIFFEANGFVGSLGMSHYVLFPDGIFSVEGGIIETLDAKKFADLELAMPISPMAGSKAQCSSKTLSFVMNETCLGKQSFILLNTTVSVSAELNIFAIMPITIDVESNSTVASPNTGAWVSSVMIPEAARITVVFSVNASIGSATQSIKKVLSEYQTWTWYFKAPFGTSEINVGRHSIPTMDTIIGKVTVSVHLRLKLAGHVFSELTVRGPAMLDLQKMRWTNPNCKTIIGVTFTGEEYVELLLNSPMLYIEPLAIILSFSASVATLSSSSAYHLGELSIDLESPWHVSGSPTSLKICEFSPPLLRRVLPLIILGCGICTLGILVAVAFRKRKTVKKIAELEGNQLDFILVFNLSEFSSFKFSAD